MTTKVVARELKVSKAWARRVKQHRGLPRRAAGGSKPKFDDAAAARLAGRVEEKPDATIEELRAWAAQNVGITASVGCVWNTLARLKLTLKKSR